MSNWLRGPFPFRSTILAAEPQLQDGLVNAADVMRPPVEIGERDTVRAAFEMLASHQLRELPVIDDQRRVVAMIDEVAIAHAYIESRRASLEHATTTPSSDTDQ